MKQYGRFPPFSDTQSGLNTFGGTMYTDGETKPSESLIS